MEAGNANCGFISGEGVMDSQKFENILNLALDAESEVRDKSMESHIG